MPRRSKGLSRAEREAHYRLLLQEFEASGLSLQKFAASKGMPYTTLAYWKGRLARGGAPRAFREVVVSAATVAPGPAFELELGPGRWLRIPRGFDADELQRLLETLERPC